MVIFHSYVTVYQRVDDTSQMIINEQLESIEYLMVDP